MIEVVELQGEKGALVVLMPVSALKQLIDLSNDLVTKVTVMCFGDAREDLVKAIAV